MLIAVDTVMEVKRLGNDEIKDVGSIRNLTQEKVQARPVIN